MNKKNLLSEPIKEFLQIELKKGRSIIIAGPTMSGKTTLIQELIPLLDREEKILVYENPKELTLTQLYSDRYILEVDAFENLSIKERLNILSNYHPHRFVWNEIRSGEDINFFLSGIMLGHRGITTLHAIHKDRVLERMQTLMIGEYPHLTPEKVMNFIKSEDQIIIFLQRNLYNEPELDEIQYIVNGEVQTVTLV